jgi:hypothetical protein
MTTRQLPMIGGHPNHLGGTLRSDRWWVGPLITFTVLSSFIVYTSWAIFESGHYYTDPYLSPLYSPVLFAKLGVPGGASLEHAWFGEWPSWWPDLPFLPASPALLILPFPGLFRFTCYYYRKGYYRSFVGSPPGCAVSPGRRPKYRGETRYLLFQNLHRYTLYFALGFVAVLSYDACRAFFRDGRLGIGVGSVVLTVNAALLASYVFGCHSLRHLVGGRKDCMSCGKNTLTYGAWQGASWFNVRHMGFGWASMIWVVLSDAYVRLVCAGVLHDFNTWGE